MHIRHARKGTAVHALNNGDAADWGVAEQFLAGIHDGVWLANWQRTVDGSKNRNRPRPVVRPWDTKPVDRAGHFGSGAIPVGDWDKWWNDN